MPIFKLTETLIRAQGTEQLFEQGQTYYQQGAVGTLVQRGDMIESKVKSGATLRHHPRIWFHEQQIISSKCTCLKGEGWCGHITATLLKCLYQAEKIEARPTLDILLTHLSRGQLQALVSTLVNKHPALLSLIEHLLSFQQVATADSQQHLQVAAHLIRRQVRATLSYGFDNDPFWELLNRIATFIQSGEMYNALTMLEIVTEESVQQWKKYLEEYEYEDDGTIANCIDELDILWAEVFLSLEGSLEQRDYWEKLLNNWANDLVAEGSYFTTALAALKYGWHHAHLQPVLEGPLESSPWTGESPPDNQLVKVYLGLLAQQRRYQEYLCLAKVSKNHLDYVVMLWQLNQKKEACLASLTLLRNTVVSFFSPKKAK